jgi:prepilin-type N-terminal cleavage/methylation domain-containing protein
VTQRKPGSADPRGFTMVETIVSVALLGIIALTVLGGLLFGMTEAHSGLNRAGAAAWAQAELDYLRVQGYTNLATGSRTLTQTTGYTTYGSLSEPQIPAGYDHAVVTVNTVGGLQVKQATITLYQAPSSVYATLSIYVANYTQPSP